MASHLHAHPPPRAHKMDDSLAASPEAKQQIIKIPTMPPPTEKETSLEAVSTRARSTSPPPRDEAQLEKPSIATNMNSETPASVNLTLHDASVTCICPAGTKREAKHLFFTGAQDGRPTWMHLLCKPYSSVSETPVIPDNLAAGNGNDDGDGTGNGAAQAANILTNLVGEPTAKEKLMIDNLTTKFHCDGPCNGSDNFSDYFNCKKCRAWQHKSCMLYGEEGDVGGPVCNRCYMSFLLHHDETRTWQRRRLLQAVREAWDWLKDPENREKHERRRWVTKFVARYFHHNQGVFIKYVSAQRPEESDDEDNISETFSDMPRTNLSPQAPETIEDEPQSRRRLKPRPVLTERTAEDDYRDLGIEQPTVEAPPESDSDEIQVSSVKKSKGKQKETVKIKEEKIKSESPYTPPKPKKRSSRAATKKPATKRKRSESSPRRAPRKSVRPKKTHQTVDPLDGEVDEDFDFSPMAQAAVPKNKHLKGVDGRTSCRCWGITPAAKDCILCEQCSYRQHKACADDIADDMPKICNICYNLAVKQEEEDNMPVTQQRPALAAAAVQTASAIPAVTADYATSIRDEILSLSSTILWKEYFLIPPCPADSTPPPFPPITWLVEMQKRLLAFLEAAGPEKVTQNMWAAISVFPRQKADIMRALRNFAVDEIFTGSMKGKRKELSVLAEVLGLEEKGSLWEIPEGA